MEGPEREAMLAKASAGKRNMRKSKEEQNLSMWSKNPSNQFLREIGPKTIVENIYQFGQIKNPTAGVYYTLLAIWKNCVRGSEPDVIQYLERAGRRMMQYKDQEFVNLSEESWTFQEEDY